MNMNPLYKKVMEGDDNPVKLMSIAMKPLGQPPFPIERIEEMTGMMGGEGSLQQSRQ